MPFTNQQHRHVLKYAEKRQMAVATLQLHRMNIGGTDIETEPMKRLVEYIKYLDAEHEDWLSRVSPLHGDFAN